MEETYLQEILLNLKELINIHKLSKLVDISNSIYITPENESIVNENNKLIHQLLNQHLKNM